MSYLGFDALLVVNQQYNNVELLRHKYVFFLIKWYNKVNSFPEK
tara:strand:- start:205 stop:336 length:132 start_codon:yes stop_codon:yes gene_type:complete